MSYIYLPPIKPVPEGASMEERKRMYEEAKAELIRFNPDYFTKDGKLKAWYEPLIGLFGRK